MQRELLYRQLSAGLDGRLTTILAPAGFGKTTLLSQWIHHSGMPAVWLSVDQLDNDVVRFWRYIIHAIANCLSPALEERIAPLLQAYPSVSIYTFLDAFIHECSVHPSEIVLVIDDFHLIHEKQIHDSLTYWIDYLPANVRLFIATRAELPFATSKWKMRGEWTHIDAKQLLFSRQEARQFYQGTLPFSLSVQQLDKLLNSTEGWVAGLQLVAISAQGSTNYDRLLNEFSGSHKHVADYLFHEVFQGLPDEIQEFLLRTSILQRMDSTICDCLMQGKNSSLMLEKVNKLSLFLLPLDDTHTWYRYHHLFSEFLRNQLKSTAPQTWTSLHRTASESFAQRGLFDEAIDHAIAAGDYDYLTNLLESHIVTVLQRGEFATLVRWFESIPATTAPLSPFLSLLYAFILVVLGRFDQAEELLQSIGNRLDAIESDVERREILGGLFFVKANLVFASGDFQQWFQHAEQYYEGLPESPIFYHFNYNTTEPFIRLTSFGLKGMLSSHTEIIGKRFSDILAARGWQDSFINLYVLQSLAEGYYEWNRLEESAAFLQQVEKAALRKQAGGLLIPNRLTQARHHLAKGKPLLAREAIDETIQWVQQFSEYHWLGPLRAFRARTYLAEGNIDDAANELHMLQLTSEEKPALHRGLEFMTLARLLLCQGKETDAMRLLEMLKAASLREGLLTNLTEIAVMQALIESKLGNRTSSLQFLREALLIGEQNGYIRSFLDEGYRMAQLLKDYALQKKSASNRPEWQVVSTEYLQKLQSLLDQEENSEKRVHEFALLDPLTQKELSILQMLTQGASNKEIAHHLKLSEGTVKVYLNRIYSKLGVSSRTQALLKAQDLRLI